MASGTYERLRLGLVLFGLTVLVVSGCAPERPPVYPVKGQLFWDGKPAAGAVVFLHPVLANEVNGQNPNTERPMGRVGPDGSFEISTFGKKDGAPIGQYRITLLWTQRTDGARSDSDEKSLLPAEYMDATRSILPVINVREGANELPKFDLKP